MNRAVGLAVPLVFACLPAIASEPGEPLSGDDFVLAMPGIVGSKIMEFAGFETLFDVIQTYTPTSGPLSFRVPCMPEGFQHADYFDTYWGDLASVGDWSRVQPLRCGYPATAPSVGDHLTVEDTLPTPAPGQGYYYVTAVNYQGQRRYGRQANGGVLNGRNPAVLPECTN